MYRKTIDFKTYFKTYYKRDMYIYNTRVFR